MLFSSGFWVFQHLIRSIRVTWQPCLVWYSTRALQWLAQIYLHTPPSSSPLPSPHPLPLPHPRPLPLPSLHPLPLPLPTAEYPCRLQRHASWDVWGSCAERHGLEEGRGHWEEQQGVSYVICVLVTVQVLQCVWVCVDCVLGVPVAWSRDPCCARLCVAVGFTFICLSASLSVCLSVCLSVRPSVCLSFYLSICPSVCLSVHLSVCLSVCWCTYTSAAG